MVILQFFLKYIPHICHCNALNVFFTWTNTRIWSELSHLQKNSKMKWYLKKHLQKNTIFFWFQVGDMKISKIFYKTQNLLRTSWSPIITTNGINFLMARPLKRVYQFIIPKFGTLNIKSCFTGGYKCSKEVSYFWIKAYFFLWSHLI